MNSLSIPMSGGSIEWNRINRFRESLSVWYQGIELFQVQRIKQPGGDFHQRKWHAAAQLSASPQRIQNLVSLLEKQVSGNERSFAKISEQLCK